MLVDPVNVAITASKSTSVDPAGYLDITDQHLRVGPPVSELSGIWLLHLLVFHHPTIGDRHHPMWHLVGRLFEPTIFDVHKTSLLRASLPSMCHGNHSHDDREVASLYCNDWTLTIPDSVLCSSTCEGCLISLKQ